jgi:hypothetical protein
MGAGSGVSGVVKPCLATSTPNAQPRGRGGQPFGIIGHQDTANQILARRNRATGVGALVPSLPEGEAFPSVEWKEAEGSEQSLTSKPGPDQPPTGVGDSKIGGRSSSQELQRQRYLAGIGHGENQRHRLAAAGASRCLQGQTEPRLLRRQLSA